MKSCLEFSYVDEASVDVVRVAWSRQNYPRALVGEDVAVPIQRVYLLIVKPFFLQIGVFVRDCGKEVVLHFNLLVRKTKQIRDGDRILKGKVFVFLC